jgi:hypothetical protein
MAVFLDLPTAPHAQGETSLGKTTKKKTAPQFEVMISGEFWGAHDSWTEYLCMARNADRSITLTNGLFQRQNSITFLASHPNGENVAAGVVARLSTNDQQMLAMQNRAMREYAGRRGWRSRYRFAK